MAAIELLVEVRQAKEAVQSIDKRFENLDKSIDKVGDTFSRLEKSMDRIAASINKIVDPINKLNDSLGSLTRATGAYGKQIKLIEKANKRLSKELDKAKEDLKKTAENLARKARAANKANKELEKLNNQLIKSGRKMNIFGFEVGGVNRALNQMNIKIKASEYMFSILAQAVLTFVAQNVVGYLIRMTDQFKLMESRLRIVNSNITTLNTNLGSTVAIALATRQSLFAVGNLMARIGRNSLELKKNTLELASATSTISKAFQIAGATAEEARNAIVQLSQALASGRLQGDELRSILELAPTLAESISKSIGITVGQLRSFAREGLITTEVMLASISQSTKEINEAFAKIRPTVSQALTNVQTSVQALLGFQNTFREANDALARSFLSLAGFIRDFSKNEAKLDPLARVLKTLAENLVAIGAAAVQVTLYFGAYLLIVKSVTSAMKAAAAATAAFNTATAMSPIGRIGSAIAAVVGYLAKLAAGIFIVNKGFETFGAVNENVGLMANSIKDVTQVLKEVEDGIKKTNKEAAEFAEKMGTVAKVLTPEEETTRRWAALTEAVNYTREAVKQLDDKIKDQKRSLKEFEGSAKETYRNIAAGIETAAIAISRSIGAIFVAIKNLIEMSASGFTLLGQYIQLPFDAAMSKLGISEKAYQSRLKSIETHTKSFVDSLNEMKGAFTGIIPTEDELSITNSILGKSVEARKKEIKELEKAKSDAENKLADLETELIENSVKKQKNAQELILAQIKAQTEAAINQYRLEAKLARESFDLAFREPFNIRFQSTQSSLDQFAAGFQQDFNKTLQGLVPDAAFDITDFIFKDKGESPFIAKNFLNQVRGLQKEVSQLTADDIIPLFGLGSKSKSGDFPYESEFVERLMEMSEPLKKSIQKLREEKVDPLLPKQLAAKAVELVEKYSSGVLQTLLTIEAQLVKQLKTSVQTAEQDKESLRFQLASVAAARAYTKTRLSGLAKENIQISQQVVLQQNAERMRLNSIGITNEEINKGTTEVGKQAKIFLEMIASNAEITKQIKEQTLLNEINNELISSDKKLASLKLELREIEKGSSEFEIQKKQREALHEEENKVIKALRENEGVSTEIVDLYQQMVNKKFELLNTEQQITEQIREQQNLQKSEEQLAEARLMKQAEKLGADRFAESGFFNRIFVEAGGKVDLDLRMTKDIQDIIKARIESGVSALDIKLAKTGEVLIDEDYFKTLDPKIKEIREQNFNVILEKLRLDRTEVVRKNILNNRVDPNVIEYTGGSKGGYLRGAPHSSGGIKGFLYGQPIELEGGEFVISKTAVEKYGVSMFEALNAKKFRVGGFLPGTEITIEKAYELANKLSARGMTVESNKFRSAIASFYDQQGIPTFNADGSVIGDRRAVTRSGREKVLREREEAALEASSKARYEEIESVTKLTAAKTVAENLETEKVNNTAKAIRVMNESTKAVSSFRKQIQVDPNTTPKNLGFAGSSMSQETIDSLDNAMKPPIGFWEDFTNKTIGVFAAAAGQAPGGMAGIKDIASIFSSTAEPISGSIKILTQRLAQNERFQKSLERFFELFYTIFDEVAEGLAFIFEAIVDLAEPLKPILQMVGSSLREVLKAFTQIIRPFSILLESLQPVLVYLTGFLQIAVSVIATIFNFFGQGLTSIFTNLVGMFGMDVGEDYKSLNLLKQERDILGEINSSISGLADTLRDVQDVMYDIQTSALNIAAPGVKLEIAAEKYDELYRAATAIGADDQAINEFTAFAKQYLQQAQDVLKTSNAYQQIYIGVMDDIEGLQKSVADTVGGLATKEIQKAVFNLGLAGSSLGDDIVQVVESVKAGIIGYDDFIQYVGFKLAQTGQDIELKEFAEFGNITGDSLNALVDSFYAFRDTEFDRIAKGLKGASNASTVADDFKTLFGIDTLGNKIQGTTPLIISELVEAVDTYGRDSAQVRKILDRQPTLGDIRDPGDVSQDPSKDEMSFDFTKLTGPDLLGPLIKAVEKLFEDAVKVIEKAWSLIETNVKGLIAEIDKVYKEALKLLETNLKGIIAELEKGFKKLKENIESLGDIDLGNALQVNLDSLKSQLDNIGIDLSGVNLASEITNALDDLGISGLTVDLQENLQGAIDKAIGEAEVIFEKLRMLKNPFHPAIGPDYLIEFEKGGLLQGPSHSQGGIKATVGGRRMVELEGGEYIINKKTTKNLGLEFLDKLNSTGSDREFSGKSYNKLGMQKFENGGLNVFADQKSHQLKDIFFGLNHIVSDITKSLDVTLATHSGPLTEKNPKAPSARSGPSSINRLFEPQNKIGNLQVIDIGLETDGVLEDIFGRHGFNLDIDFPGGINGEIFDTGGYVRQYYHNMTSNNLMPSSKMDSDASMVKRRSKFEIPAYIDEKRGILNETATRPDRLRIGISQSGNFTEDELGRILPGGPFSAISSAIRGALGTSLELLEGAFSLVSFFGGDLIKNYTEFSPFAGLRGEGEAYETIDNIFETIALSIAFLSAASYLEELMGGDPVIFGGFLPKLTTVNDFLRAIPFLSPLGKDDFIGESKAFIPALLGLAPLFTANNELIKAFGLETSSREIYGENAFSFLDVLNLGTQKGAETFSNLNDLQKLLFVYAGYEASNFLFGLDLFSPIEGISSLFAGGGRSRRSSFGGGRSSYSRGERSAIGRMPDFLGGSSRSSSGRSSYSRGSRGERSAIARMPDFLEQGGLAVGPSHDSGMLGLAGGSPFLFEGGEYIVNKDAVDKIGVNTLNKINQGNLPKFADGGSLAGGSLEHLQERSFFGKIADFFTFNPEDGWGNVFKGLMVGLGAAASYGVYQLLQGTSADADYIDRDYADDVTRVANYAKDLIENPYKIMDTATGTMDMAFGAVEGTIDTISKNFSDIESKGLIHTLEHLASLDYLDTSTYFGSPGEALGAAIGEAFRGYYQRFIGQSKPFDPLTIEKLKYAGLEPGIADNVRYVLSDRTPIDTLYGDIFLGTLQFLGDSDLISGKEGAPYGKTYGEFVDMLDAGHPVAFVTDNLTTIRTNSGYFRNAVDNDLVTPSSYNDPGNFVANGNLGPFNIWEYAGALMAHEALHSQQYKNTGGHSQGSRKRFKNFFSDYIDNFSSVEFEAMDFAGRYSSIFGNSTRAKKPALNMPDELLIYGGTKYYYPIQMFGKSFDKGYIERNFDTNWFNDTNPEFGYFDYFRPPTTAVNPQAPSSNYPEFGSGGSLMSGGVASGPSHQGGMMGFSEGGGPFLFEGGEYIINKDATKALGIDFLDSLNTGGAIPQAGMGDPLQQLLISQRRTPNYMYGTMSAQDMRMQAANILLPMAFTGELGLFSSDLSRSFGNQSRLSSGLFGAGVGLLYGGLLGALVGNRGKDNVALSLLFSGIGSYSGVSQNRPENYPSGRSLFDFDRGGIVGFDPFVVSAMGDISTSLRVGPRYQSQQPDYGFGFMDFMSLMGIFALLNNMRFMGNGGSLPFKDDPYLDPRAYGKARDNRYNRSTRGKAGRISKAIYKDLSSFFGPIGDYLVPDFLNPFGEEASIQGFLKSIFYDIPIGIYNFATESVPNYFSSVFGIGGEKSRRAKASHEGFFGFGQGGVIPSLYMGGDKYGSLGSGRKTRYVDDRTVFKKIFDYGENKSGSSISEIMKDIDIFYAKKRLGHAKQAAAYSKPGKPFDFGQMMKGIFFGVGGLAYLSAFFRRKRPSDGRGLGELLNKDLEPGETDYSDFEKILALGSKGTVDPARLLFYAIYTGMALDSLSEIFDYPKFLGMKNPLYSRKSGGTIPEAGLGSEVELFALLFAGETARRGYNLKDIFGVSETGSRFGDAGIGFLTALIPFFVGANIDQIRVGVDTLFGRRKSGGVIPQAGAGIFANFSPGITAGIAGSLLGSLTSNYFKGGHFGGRAADAAMLGGIFGGIGASANSNIPILNAMLASGLLSYLLTPNTYSSDSIHHPSHPEYYGDIFNTGGGVPEAGLGAGVSGGVIGSLLGSYKSNYYKGGHFGGRASDAAMMGGIFGAISSNVIAGGNVSREQLLLSILLGSGLGYLMTPNTYSSDSIHHPSHPEYYGYMFPDIYGKGGAIPSMKRGGRFNIKDYFTPEMGLNMFLGGAFGGMLGRGLGANPLEMLLLMLGGVGTGAYGGYRIMNNQDLFGNQMGSGGSILSMRRGGRFNIKDYFTPEMGLNMFLGGMFGGMLGSGMRVDPITMMLLTLSGLGMGAYGGYRAINNQDLFGNPMGKGGSLPEAGLGGPDFGKFMLASMLLLFGSQAYEEFGGNKRAASIGKGIGFGTISAGYSYAMMDLARDKSQSDAVRALGLYFGLAPLIGPIGFTESYPHFMPYEAIASGFRGELGKGGRLPEAGLGGDIELMALLFAGLAGRSGFYGGSPFSTSLGQGTYARLGDAGLSSLLALFPFFMAANAGQFGAGVDTLLGRRASGGSVPEAKRGRSILGLEHSAFGALLAIMSSQGLTNKRSGSNKLMSLLGVLIGGDILTSGITGNVSYMERLSDFLQLDRRNYSKGGEIDRDQLEHQKRDRTHSLIAGLLGLPFALAMTQAGPNAGNMRDPMRLMGLSFLLMGIVPELRHAFGLYDYSDSSGSRGSRSKNDLFGGKVDLSKEIFMQRGMGGSIPSLGLGENLGGLAFKGFSSYVFGQSIYDFIMSDNKFSTPKGAPPNQVSPLTWMLMTGFFQQLMMRSGLKTGFGMGGILPEAKRGDGILDMLSADKNSTVFFSKDESLKASLLTLPIALAFATNPEFNDPIRALSLMFALRTIPELLYGLEGRKLPGFGKGGSLVTAGTGLAIGPSHQSGMLGMTKNGMPFLFEGGEYIINKDAADSLGIKALDQLNRGNADIFADGGSINGNDSVIGERRYSKFTLYADKANIDSISSINAENNFEQYSASKIIPAFARGGSLQTIRSGPAIGPDHQSGMLGLTKQGAPFLFEGGEYIFSKAAASRIGSSNLDQLNKGKIPGSMASGGVIPEKDLGAGLIGLVSMAPFMMEEIDEGVASLGRGVNYFFENIYDFFMMLHPFQYIGSGGSILEAGGGLSILEQLEVISNYDKKGGSRSKRRGMSSRELSSLGEGLGLFSTGIASLGILDLLTGGKQIGARDNPLLFLLSLIGSGIYFSNKFGSGGSIPSFKNGINLSPGYAASIVFDQDYGKLGKYTAGTIGLVGGLKILNTMLGSDDEATSGFLSKEGLQNNFGSLLLASLIGSGALFGGAALLRGTYTGKGFMSGASDISSLFTGFFRSGGVIPQASVGGLAASLLLAGYGTGFGDFLGGSASRNNPMTAGRAGKGFGQFLGTLAGSAFLFSALQDKNPLNLLLGLGTIFGTNLAFADTPRGRSTNPFSFSNTQKYNRSMFASGGEIPSFGLGDAIDSLADFGSFGGTPSHDILGSLVLLGLVSQERDSLDFRHPGGGAKDLLRFLLVGGLGAYGLAKGAKAFGLVGSSYRKSKGFRRGGSGDIPFFRPPGTFSSGGLLPSFAGGFDLGALGYLFGGSGYVGGKLSKDKDLGYAGAGATGFGLGALGGLALMLMGGTKVSDTQKLQGIISFGLLNSLVSLGTYGAMSNNMFASGGAIPSYKAGEFPIPDAFTMGSIGVGAGVGAFLGSVLGKDNEELLPILMLTGILGGGFLGKFFGQRRRQGFDLFGNLLPRHGKIRSRVNYGSGGSIPSFQAGGIAKGPSHESGMVGYSKSGGPFMFEGGEYIIRKSSVDKLGVGTLDALNSGMYSMGKGGFLPSFEEGTNMGGIPIQAGMFARRDLFGIKSSDDTEEVYVTNYADMSGAGIYGASTVELLAGISLILQSMLVSTYNEEGNYLKLSTIANEQLLVLEMFASNQFEIPDVIVDQQGVEHQAYVMTELLDENNKIIKDNEGEAIMVKTQQLTEEGLKYQKTLTDAGIKPGKLLRVELSLLGPFAMSQLAMLFGSMAPQAPSLDDQLFSLAVQGAVDYAGLTGAGAALATLGIYHGRETAEEGKGDLAALAGIVALTTIGSPVLATVAAVAAAEVIGKPENYFAEIGMDEQMDLQEPVTGLYDELVGEKGILTYPAKFFSQLDVTQPGNAIANAGDRLNEGAAHMNMNSQKLSAAMSRAFGMDESEMQFDALGGLETTISDIDTYSEIEQQFTTGFENLGERTKQLGEAMFKDIGEAIVNFLKSPVDFLNNFGKQIQDNIQGSTADLLGAYFRFPQQIMEFINSITGEMLTKVIEATQRLLVYPLDFFSEIGAKVGQMILAQLGELPTRVQLILENMVSGFFSIPKSFADQLFSGGMAKSLEMLPEIITGFVQAIVDIPLFFIKTLVESDHSEIALKVATILPLTGIDAVLSPVNLLLQSITGGVDSKDTGFIDMPEPLKGILGMDYLLPFSLSSFGIEPPGEIFPKLAPEFQRGGYAVGPSHAEGGIPGIVAGKQPIEFEGGEFIINKDTVDFLGVSLFQKLNSVKTSSDFSASFANGDLVKIGNFTNDILERDFGVGGTGGQVMKRAFGFNGLKLDLNLDGSSLDFASFANGGGLYKMGNNFSGRHRVFGFGPEKMDESLAKAFGLERFGFALGGEIPKYFFGGATKVFRRVLKMFLPTWEANLGVDLGNPGLYGGADIRYQNGGYVDGFDSSPSNGIGLSIMGGVSSGGSEFTSSLIASTNVSNQLLNKLIQVVEEKDLSVNINNEPVEETPTEDIRLSVDRERAYRGSRMLA